MGVLEETGFLLLFVVELLGLVLFDETDLEVGTGDFFDAAGREIFVFGFDDDRANEELVTTIMVLPSRESM